MTNIKKARESARLTQKQVADEIGIPKRTLENYEQGSRQPAPWIEKLLIAEIERIGENIMLKEKIENTLDKEIMKNNTMGSEVASATILLTDKEKEEFLKSVWTAFDDKTHTWDFTENELTVCWCEDGFYTTKYDVYEYEEEVKHWKDIHEGCAIRSCDSDPVLLGSFVTLDEAKRLLSKQEASIHREETFTGHVWMVKEAWIEKNQYDSDDELVETLEDIEAMTDFDSVYEEAKERYDK